MTKHLRGATLFVSPIAVMEMALLREIGRLREPVDKLLEILTEDHGVEQAQGDVVELGRQAGGVVTGGTRAHPRCRTRSSSGPRRPSTFRRPP